MYKVFINEKVFYLSFNIKKSFLSKNIEVINCNSLEMFNKIISTNGGGKKLIVNFPTLRMLNKILELRFRIVKAGGGIVLNSKKEILFIFRKGKWDLPKGKAEKGENIEECAVREIEEECGISEPVISHELITTFHKYKSKKQECLKKTYWFLMNYKGNEKLTPQLEESITKVKWISIDKLDKVYNNTFPSIKDVLEVYLNTIK